MYGPTTGDKIRLGDTNLYAEIERDCASYGDECVFGGGKVIRDGMGQTCGNQPADSLDTVITNAVIIDYTGIFKSDIGIKDGIIFALGKAGNPDTMDGVSPNMVVGVSLYSVVPTCFNHFCCTSSALFVTVGKYRGYSWRRKDYNSRSHRLPRSFHMPSIGI